ncbi:hypothetical protein PG985_014297 [Apiospora marii]|uniref:uncharacterized protein n=1 Tax=Apiospora marii TaxID=335849 RepID=UPI00312DFE5A
MKSYAFAGVALAAVARAQLLDLEDLATSVPAPVVITPPFGGDAELLATRSTLRYAKRDTPSCPAQAQGTGPQPEVDSAAGFVNSPLFAETAANAPTPDGYFNTFQNAKGSIEGVGYKTMKTIESYSPDACATACNEMDGCNAFNILYERNGLSQSGNGCPRPASTTIIKCTFWTVPVVEEHATNVGSGAIETDSNQDFVIVIAASNGYVSNNFKAQPGWPGPSVPVDAAINAPLDNGKDTFIRSQTFPISADYKGSNCVQACSEQAAYEYAHPSAGGARACQFVNSYLLLKNGVAQSQVCSMYTQPWNATTYATNYGQARGNDKYTITFGLTYTNGTVATAL